MNAVWQTKRLGEICEIELGKTPARANKAFWDENRETSNVWLSIADLLNAEDNVATDSKEYLSDKGAAVSKIVRKGTLLVSFKLTLGRVAFAGRDLYTNEAIAALNLFNERDPSKEFLFYFLHFFDWRRAAENDVKLKGMTLNKAKLKELKVPFPPLPEQQRIVRILDDAFDSISTAKANAEKNLQNARALFERHLQSVFTERGEGWVEKPLGALASFRNGINYTQSSNGDRVKVVGVKDFQKSFWVPSQNLDTVTIDGKLSELDLLREGDILTVRSNGNVQLIGRCIVAPEIREKMSHSGFTIRIRLSNGEVLPEYVGHFMKCISSRKQLTDGGTGTNIKSLNQQTLSSLKVPYPPSSKQKVLVAKLELISKEIERLETIYKRKLAALEALKKSLLHQAFTGVLQSST